MDLIVFHNPDAGGGEWNAKRVKHLLRDAGHTARITSSRRKWREALREEPDAFVVVGGDGTVHEVIHALEGRAARIAILPTGTANNVAYALGYRAGDDLAERVRHWMDNETTLQIPVIESGGHARSFIESAGFGAFAQMMHDTSAPPDNSDAAVELLVSRKRLVKQIRAAEPVRVSVTIDGATSDGEYLLLECLNLPLYGPRLRLAAHESADAATVTVCGVGTGAIERAAHWIATGEGDSGAWTLGRGTAIELTADARVHVDGEMWRSEETRGAELRIRAGARAVRICV